MKEKTEIISIKLKGILVRGILSVLLGVVLMMTGMSVNLLKNEGAETIHAAAALYNPRNVSDSSMTTGQKTTWDCVWFGSYPQTEIVNNKEICGTYGKDWGKTTDYVKDDKLYSKLKSATGWNSRGDLTIDGEKYRRIKKSDATYLGSNDRYYHWNDSSSYHYFRYDKIKWRVLDVSGSRAFLLADQVLDDQKYNTEYTSVTWARSTIRSWLNGYNDSTNNCGTDFTGKNYIDSAFSSEEQGAIVSTNLDNKATGPYSDRYGGDNTSDKVFLLAYCDLYNSDTSASYGFYKGDFSEYDEARGCKSSTYAKAMGIYTDSYKIAYTGNCTWWLRSPGNESSSADYVCPNGPVDDYGQCVDCSLGVRPALNLNLSSSDQWSYAGTVCSDGTTDKEDIRSAICTLNKENYPYTGKVILPDIAVTFKGETLTPGTDYTISSKSKAAGKAVATITGKGDYIGSTSVTYRISPASLAGKKLGLTRATYTYNAKVQKPTVKIVGDKKLKAGTDYTIKYSNASSKAAGTYTLTVTGKGNYTGTSAKATYKINKAANPLTVKAKTATVKFSAVKKKAQTLTVSKVLAVSRKQGKVTYVKAGGNAKITINKTIGKVTVKKGLKKGTYKIKVKVKAAGNANYKAVTKIVTFKVKVS